MPQKEKPASNQVAGFLVPIWLVLAPQPGLEPGTYGLTVRPNRYLPVLIAVAKIHINQQLRMFWLDK